MLLPRGAQRSLRSARTQQRTLWSTVTLISTSPSSLLSHLKDQPTSPATTATLFALSKNTPQDLVASFRSALTPSPAAAVAGCLSEVLPPSLLPSSASSGEVFSLSLARWSPDTPSERAVLFRSSLTGRPNIALGREIKPEADHDGAGSDAGFEAFLRGEKWGFGDQASGKKANGEGISELNGVKCVFSSIRSFLMLFVQVVLTTSSRQLEGRVPARLPHCRPTYTLPFCSFRLPDSSHRPSPFSPSLIAL